MDNYSSDLIMEFSVRHSFDKEEDLFVTEEGMKIIIAALEKQLDQLRAGGDNCDEKIWISQTNGA